MHPVGLIPDNIDVRDNLRKPAENYVNLFIHATIVTETRQKLLMLCLYDSYVDRAWNASRTFGDQTFEFTAASGACEETFKARTRAK